MTALLSVVLLLFLFSLVSTRLRTPPALGHYFINWDGGMKACEGMENKVFDLEKLVVEKKNKTVVALVGDVGLTQETSDAVKFVLTVLKSINGNYEYLMTITEDNLCKHLAQKNKPWTPFVTEMGIKGCPIPKKVYSFKESSLDLAGFPLSAAHAGSYRTKIEMFERGERMTCLTADVSVQPQ